MLGQLILPELSGGGQTGKKLCPIRSSRILYRSGLYEISGARQKLGAPNRALHYYPVRFYVIAPIGYNNNISEKGDQSINGSLTNPIADRFGHDRGYTAFLRLTFGL